MRGEHVWQFNEAVSLLREARMYAPPELGDEIDERLPEITTALKEAAEESKA